MNQLDRVHASHHRAIERDVGALRATPKGRSGHVQRIRHREALKAAWWTLRGHLRSHHRTVRLTPWISVDELIEQHEALHSGRP